MSQTDWATAGAELDPRGWALLPDLVDRATCDTIAGQYDSGTGATVVVCRAAGVLESVGSRCIFLIQAADHRTLGTGSIE